MKSFIYFLTTYTTKRNITIGIILIVIFNVMLLPKFPKLVSTKKVAVKSILDLKFSYTADTVYTIFEDLGEIGRNAYQSSEIIIDFPYAIIYGFTYAFLILFLLKINKLYKLYYLSLVPFFISWFDILENTGILIMLSKYPTKLETICNLTSTFTSLKWVFAGFTFLIIFSNILKLVISKFHKK